MTDPKQREYEQAVDMLPEDVKIERAAEYHEFVEVALNPIQERINLITSVQEMVKDEHGDVQRKWTKESWSEVVALRAQKQLLEENAIDKFWEGYEHLRPEDE